ncbi:MAG TPA: ribokinase [Candidatus Saccharimonadales bacterium]|nr:ribokinase [Candidatus Saccharimonadales bacterium]
MPSIWVVGSTMVDMITYAARPPAAGETLVGDRFDLGFGGKGANQAVTCARLGAQVTMVNAVGDDPFGAMTIDNLRAEGIDVRHVATIAGESTGAAPILVEPDGTNRILVVPGANARLEPADAAAVIEGADSLDVVVGQLEIEQPVTAAAFRAARARGAATILNPAPAATLHRDLLDETDWLVPNEVEVAHLAVTLGLPSAPPADAGWLAAIQRATGTRVVVTLGAGGAIGLGDDGSVIRVAATPVVAVDTTGAGDAFVGGLAFALASGADLEAAMRLACALASDSVRRPGTQKSFPSPEAARGIVRDRGDVPIPDHLPH